MQRTTRLNLTMRSHFNDYYYISGDFRNGFLFALSGEHKQNELSEINNESMNDLLRLAQPRSRRAPWSSRRRHRARARVSPQQRAAYGVAGLSAKLGLPSAAPRPPPSPPRPPALEARGLALGPDRREKRAEMGFPPRGPAQGCSGCLEAARGAGWGSDSPEALGASRY